MRNNVNKIGKTFSRAIGKFKKLSNLGRGKAALAAAVGTAGLLGTNAFGALADVQSIQTQLLTGSTTTVNNVHGVGGSSGFTSGHSYNMHYAGEDLEITKITTATGSYSPTALATAVVDRASGPNNDTIWYRGSGNSGSTNLNLMSKQVNGMAQAFGGNNILAGTDNLFTNTGNNQANNTNIERLDLLFSGGIKTDISKVFSIFERGFTNQHDGFKIAAITALDGSGNPSNYGTVLTVGAGTYGKTDAVSSHEYIVTRKNDSIAGDAQHPSDMVNQPIGGVVIPTTDLASNGSTIYGYSLFATDVTGAGAQLVNWHNTTFFPSNTAESQSGLDLVGTAAVLYTAPSAAIPEPATATLALIGLGGILSRRPRRQRM